MILDIEIKTKQHSIIPEKRFLIKPKLEILNLRKILPNDQFFLPNWFLLHVIFINNLLRKSIKSNKKLLVHIILKLIFNQTQINMQLYFRDSLIYNDI